MDSPAKSAAKASPGRSRPSWVLFKIDSRLVQGVGEPFDRRDVIGAALGHVRRWPIALYRGRGLAPAGKLEGRGGVQLVWGKPHARFVAVSRSAGVRRLTDAPASASGSGRARPGSCCVVPCHCTEDRAPQGPGSRFCPRRASGPAGPAHCAAVPVRAHTPASGPGTPPATGLEADSGPLLVATSHARYLPVTADPPGGRAVQAASAG